jgi:D-alanyl-D-alanine carboxypeptidase
MSKRKLRAIAAGGLRRRSVSLATAVAALAASLAIGALVPAASANPPSPPVVAALHAFVGDPLYGLDTFAGTLFAKLPDEETQMGSTTKIWTLDQTAHALAQGVVHLDDKVTINQFEASLDASNSLMVDIYGTPLEAGEVVSLGTLVRGLIYQSGNNAAFAIARHVAQAYYGPGADWQDFVALMNAHAAALGQTHTHLSNPAGVDILPHYTTARELAEEMQHGLQDPYFAQVIGFRGPTYTAITASPHGAKVYIFKWGSTDPGWEGWKLGSTPLCDGPNAGCWVMSYRRIGRRLVTAFMQGEPYADENAMLDYGFATLFHPDLSATSASGGAVSRQAVDCYSSNRAVTAVLPPSGAIRLALWNANVDGLSITKLQEATLPGSDIVSRAPRDVAVTRLSSGDIILANRKGAAVTLSRWTIARNGTLQLLASNIAAGTATTMGLQPVYGDMFLTAVTDPTGALVLKSWQLQGSGLTLLDTYEDHAQTFREVAIAGTRPGNPQNGRAVTASVGSYGGTPLLLHVWAVDHGTGKISRPGELEEGFAHAHPAVAPFLVPVANDERTPPEYFAAAYRNVADGPGNLEINFYRVDDTGKPVRVEEKWNTQIPAEQIRLAPLGTGGLMFAIRDAQGHVKLRVWDAARKPDGSILDKQVVQEDEPDALSLDLCRLSTNHAEGDFLTSTRDLDGQLRLRAYRSGDRPQ